MKSKKNTRDYLVNRLSNISEETKIWWVFKIFICWEFVGHGAFGIITKAGWLPFFRVFSIPDHISWQLMPIIGSFDILMGIITLLTPRRGILAWMTLWGLLTALLRPLSGTSFSEFFERSYNYGMPFLLLYLTRLPKNLRDIFTPVKITTITNSQLKFSATFLKYSIFSFLIGHACFGIFDKQKTLLMLHENSGLSTIFGSIEHSILYFSYTEVALALALLIKPSRSLLLIICGWKLFTEGLYIPVNKPWIFFEFIERGGSYAMPIILILIQNILKKRQNNDK